MKASDLDAGELMEFRQGRVSLQGRRVILHDLKALGLFRRDLIEMMGEPQARRILTRKGYLWGQTDAASMQRLFTWESTTEWLKAWPRLFHIAGLAECELTIHGLEEQAGRVTFEVTWRNSSETEQHLAEFGRSEHPVCWVLVGYASGYASYCLGKSVFFVERECQAAGASTCLAIGKDVASWGTEIQPHIPFFHAADLQRRLEELTSQIERQQRELERRWAAENAGRLPGVSPVALRSPAFLRTLEVAERVAKFDTTVLITGETGSGKEMLARYVHQRSPRSAGPWLTVNCSALPEALMESELFGHRAGAFTGAAQHHAGLFEEAGGGTLFLDEVGDLSPAVQAKLLRVLQEREIRRVGESRSRPVDVRVISATNQDLEAMVAAGRFREDLFYRLHVVHLRVPPLRERREDILPLARYFLKRCGQRMKKPGLRLAPACVDLLLRHAWSGNVRELENVLEHAAVLSEGDVLTPDLLPLGRPGPTIHGAADLGRSLREVESAYIRDVLARTGGNRAEAARILRIGEATLYRRLKAMSGPRAG